MSSKRLMQPPKRPTWNCFSSSVLAVASYPFGFLSDVCLGFRPPFRLAPTQHGEWTEVISSHVIPGPHADVVRLLQDTIDSNSGASRLDPLAIQHPSLDTLQDMPVARLRQLVRQTPGAGLTGRKRIACQQERIDRRVAAKMAGGVMMTEDFWGNIRKGLGRGVDRGLPIVPSCLAQQGRAPLGCGRRQETASAPVCRGRKDGVRTES